MIADWLDAALGTPQAWLTLSGAIAGSCAGRPLGRVVGIPALVLDVGAGAGEALSGPCDVFVEFSHPAATKTHVLQALTAGAHAVVGTSGLTDEDYNGIDRASR
ncbi:MAG: hypothetical protein R6W95_06205 [Desulfosarcina sp.]